MTSQSVAGAKGFAYEPMRGPKRKFEFKPRSDGNFNGVETVCAGRIWRVTGRRVVTTMQRI